ncbi:hypothetical protein [Bacillus bombysepticus]|uniref:hypothetical protein n=1 Tax=Bacillus bombysepticus TaxID=658666 RepID=UPI003018FAF7
MINMTEEIYAVESFEETPEKVMKVLNDFSKIPVKDEELEKRDKWTNVLCIRKTDGAYGLSIKSQVERNGNNNLKLASLKSNIQDYIFENHSINLSTIVVLGEISEILIFIPLAGLNGHLLNEVITYCVNQVESYPHSLMYSLR